VQIVNVQICNEHVLRVTRTVLRSDCEVVIAPIFAHKTLPNTMSVRNIITIFNLRDDCLVGELHAQASSNSTLHINYAEVVVPEARVHLVLKAESLLRALVLQCHHVPLVVLCGMAEDIDADTFVVLSVADR